MYERAPFRVSQRTSVKFGFLKVYGEEKRWNPFIKALGFSCVDSQPVFCELIELLTSPTHRPEARESPTQMEFTTYPEAAECKGSLLFCGIMLVEMKEAKKGFPPMTLQLYKYWRLFSTCLNGPTVCLSWA